MEVRRKSLGFEVRGSTNAEAGCTRERDTAAHLLDLVAREDHIHLHHLTSRRITKQMIGLPARMLACVFDLDGVLTVSAPIHAAAWADTFDEFLARRLEQTGERFGAFRPFNPATDYYEHIHGKPRVGGVHAFLASRGIRLPEGCSDDPPGVETVQGLASRKNEALIRRLDREGVRAYAGTRLYLEAAREAGLRLAVVSASANTGAILARAGLDDLIADRVDGNTIRDEHLRSKPAPDTLLAACGRLGVPPNASRPSRRRLPASKRHARRASVSSSTSIGRTGQASPTSTVPTSQSPISPRCSVPHSQRKNAQHEPSVSPTARNRGIH